MTRSYKVVSSTDKAVFEADVNEKLNEGYSLIFGCYQVVYTPDGILYTQALWKDAYDEN